MILLQTMLASPPYKPLARGDLTFPFPEKRFLGIRTKFVSQSRQRPLTYRTQDWLLLKARKLPNDSTLTYQLIKPKVKPFPLLLTDPRPFRRKVTITRKKPEYFPTVVTPQQLLIDEAKRLQITVSQLQEAPKVTVPRASATLGKVIQEWEESSRRFGEWREKCRFVEAPGEGGRDGAEKGAESLEVEIPEQGALGSAVESRSLLNESASSSIDNINKSSQDVLEEASRERRPSPAAYGLAKPHQRKFRKLRRATRNLIAWIDSLRPQKKLNFHVITLKDGTKQTVNMRPYIPFPEEFQPVPVIKEDEIVDMVQNAYGTRPALALKIDVHDMDKLPAELDKFDSYYYLRDRLFARIREREKSRMLERGEREKMTMDVGNKYSFGFRPKTQYAMQNMGNVFDATTRRRCRYGAWYLDRSLWRKAPTTEELKRPGASDSDETFERITGQKPAHPLDTPALDSAAPELRALCDLYTSKAFYRRLVARERPVPGWLAQCRGMIEAEERAQRLSRTAPHGSEVWRQRRVSRLHSVLHWRLRSAPHPHFPRVEKRSKAKHGSAAKRQQSRGGTGRVEVRGVDHVPRIDAWCYQVLNTLEHAG